MDFSPPRSRIYLFSPKGRLYQQKNIFGFISARILALSIRHFWLFLYKFWLGHSKPGIPFIWHRKSISLFSSSKRRGGETANVSDRC